MTDNADQPGAAQAEADAIDRYFAAAHAMQTGVALKMNFEPEDTGPKQLRVGVNTAMVEHSALAYLLMSKGIISRVEYFEALAQAMESERDKYQDWVNRRYRGGNGDGNGPVVTLK